MRESVVGVLAIAVLIVAIPTLARGWRICKMNRSRRYHRARFHVQTLYWFENTGCRTWRGVIDQARPVNEWGRVRERWSDVCAR